MVTGHICARSFPVLNCHPPVCSVMFFGVYCALTSLVCKCRRFSSLAGLGNVIKSPSHSPPLHQGKRTLSPDQSNPAEPLTDAPSVEMTKAAWVLRALLLNEPDHILRERKTAGGRLTVPCCASGSELVTWLAGLAPGIDRHQATTMWQALLEEGLIYHVTGEHPFKDKCVLYQFRQDRDATVTGRPPPQDIAEAEEHLHEAISELSDRGPDAWLRMILRKPSNDRTPEDLETIYEELMHMKPLSHLSNSMKRELASVIMFEAHPKSGTVVFEQGEEGRSWYLVLCGSVDVVIHGKGVVATLHSGEDFGKLALINDVPRAASIIVREDNTHLLRVDKEDFNRILRDVEANIVRLKEHGKDVLILEKSSSNNSAHKYVVMACTASRMVEHLLDSRLDGNTSNYDPALDDFLLTHVVFISPRALVQELRKHYSMDSPHHDRELSETYRRRVVFFMYRWVTTVRHPLLNEPSAVQFIEELVAECEREGWEESALMNRISAQVTRHQDAAAHTNKWKLPPGGQPICLFTHNETGCALIKPHDDIIFRVYCADHTYCTLRLPVAATAEQIKVCAADKLGIRARAEDLILVEVKSSGERVVFKDCEVSIPTTLTLNGKIFVAPKEHLDALTVIPEQEAPTEGLELDLEDVSAREMAYHMTMFDWDLFWNIHEYELLYHTFGRHRFGQSTANLDVFLRRFNELQYWVVTEICMTSSLSKRVHVLRKIIKLAAYCREFHNINGMFALVLGLSNVAVSRLSSTWDKLPGKSRKLYTQLEATIDPSRNHRAYRGVVSSMSAPLIPFMPLLLKDMTFIHEGNKTMVDGLVNFEKMHMLAQTLRTLRYCRNRRLVIDPPSPKNEAEVRAYVRCLRTIDHQRTLNSLSNKLEPRRS
ncbi:exchange factor [Nesidiocoris tenuis]|uniref:Exchange factor n=1 Tax=Nesidiocoris tenuis TaxID=355587 RepID=A0ABN7BG65_9HEMI|nr:exchange factor [Nesidiocoris tenuis]